MQRRHDVRRLYAVDRENRHGPGPERPGHHQFRHRDQDRLLEPHADAAGDAAGCEQDDRARRVPRSGADGAVPRHGVLSGGGARSCARRGSAQSRHFEGEAPLGACTDQYSARFLDSDHRHQPAGDRRVRAAGRRHQCRRGGSQAAVSSEIPGHPVGRGGRARKCNPRMRCARGAARCAGLQQLPAQRQLPRQPSACRRPARLQRLEGRDGADRPGRRGAGARHPAQSIFDPSGIWPGLLAEERQGHPGRGQSGPHRPDQAGDGRHLR